jgi:hypothetical protein
MQPTASSPIPQPANQPSPETPGDIERRSFAPEDPIMAYARYFAGWFDLAQMAAGRRRACGGFYAPPPNEP